MSNKLKNRTLFAYGSIAIPLAMLGLPLYIYLPTFYAQTVGLSVTAVGLILFFSRLTDVITDPLIGLFSDRFKSPYGKRKPFILLGSFLLMSSFYALIHPPKEQTEFWLFGFSMLVYLAWSLVSVPYLAWSAEISSNYHEKTRLSVTRELFTIMGALLALLVPYYYGVSESANESLQVLYTLFIFLLLGLLPFILFGLKERENSVQRNIGFSEFKKIWQKIPSLKNLQLAFVLNALANALPATLFLFYVELVLEEESKTGLLLLIYFTSGIIALPFWTFLANKWGKAKIWKASMILASLAFIFVPFLGTGDLLFFTLITIASGFSLGADMALPASIQADIVQKLQSKNNAYAGLLFGIWAMLTKLALALAVGLGFVILGMVGFDPNAPTALALTTISLLYAGIPVVFKLLSFWLMKDYKEAF
ncbi:MAG: FIG097052: Sugar transporter [uncultured Sulfurovum sp.]|uniref:FIG097052: Sugar transporter n=1 Tax=uncultured Sulfurovum sp. TaxID=269237 RepID=A0A6S6SG54_9BACT|nr:MAG: FIG097052: Sugar transporter [uncultured Sulfurovum sp.]